MRLFGDFVLSPWTVLIYFRFRFGYQWLPVVQFLSILITQRLVFILEIAGGF